MPAAFSLYNKYMGGVDTHDQYCSKLLPTFRSKKWTWSMLMRIIQSSITNAVIIFNHARQDNKKSSAKDFAMSISDSYFQQSKQDLTTHKRIVSTKKRSCSEEKCCIRTQLFCEDCQKYFCKNCFQVRHTA